MLDVRDRRPVESLSHGAGDHVGRELGAEMLLLRLEVECDPHAFWVPVADAHVLGSAKPRGHDVWRVSFFDPSTPGWFEVAIDKRTLHTLELSMFATAHFMHDVYGSFDEPAGIRPPGQESRGSPSRAARAT